MEPIAIFFMCAGLAALYSFGYRIGYPTQQSLLPFQSGLLYKRGHPLRKVGPGRHRVFLGSQQIVFLDTRPIQVKIEGHAIELADGRVAFYGFAASAQVSDASKAIYASATYSQLPGFVTVCVTRGTLARQRSTDIATRQAALTDEIERACKARLAQAGFALLSYRFTQLRIESHSVQQG